MDGSKLQIFRGSAESLEQKLFFAINDGDAMRVQILLKQGANINSTCLFGKTALGTACYCGKVEIVDLLLQSCQQFSTDSSKNDMKRGGHIKTDPQPIPSKEFVSTINCKSGKSMSVYKNNLSKSVINQLEDVSSEDDSAGDSDFPFYCGLKTISYTKAPDLLDEYQQTCMKKSCHNEFSPHMLTDVESSCSSQVEQDELYVKRNSPESNQGYYIVVHREDNTETGSSTLVNSNEPHTPDGMGSLEWDSDFQENNDSDHEDGLKSDAWVDSYRLYADYLAKSCKVDSSQKYSSSQCIDINQQDVYHWSAMHYAAEQGHLEIMRMLIKAGCHVDAGDLDDVTPLHLAAARDHPEAVALLISCGATVNRRSQDRTGPLHMAAARGFLETAQILLANGASVNAVDRNDRTPVMLAAARGLNEMVKLLINYGAKVNLEDIHGYTVLCQAVWQHDKDLVQLLLSSGAKLTHSDRLLHYAILHRCADVAKLLIEAGSVVNLRDDCGDTPLLIAARSGQVEVASLLLQNGAIVNYPNGITGNVPLHEAVESLRAAQHVELKELLTLFLSHGAKLNPTQWLVEDSALSRAHRHDNDQAMILLIQYGADVSSLQVQTNIVSEWYLERRPEHFIIAQLMVYAGLNLWKHADHFRYDSEYQKDSPSWWIASHKFNPLSLSDLTRLKIRHCFGDQLYRVPLITSWPSRLKTIIMLEDVVHTYKFQL